MIILEADNRRLYEGAKYSYLVNSSESGISSFSIVNASDSAFVDGAFLLLGLFGNESSEIVQIASVNNETGAITTVTPTLQPHAESTRITVLAYNQVRFFWTAAESFDFANPLTGYIDLQPSTWFSTFADENHSDGYGWFVFYNSINSVASQPSNPIPYAGFGRSSVENILFDFYSLLSNRELKLVTRNDALSWLNEGYSIVQTKLNLTNQEYAATDTRTLTTQPGTIEYDLPSDFDDMVTVVEGIDITNPGSVNLEKRRVDPISIRDAYTYTGIFTKFYIRNKYIGFVPTPQSQTNYIYIYQKKSDKLTLNSEMVDLPNNGSYIIKDWMMYRAYMKFRNPVRS